MSSRGGSGWRRGSSRGSRAAHLLRSIAKRSRALGWIAGSLVFLSACEHFKAKWIDHKHNPPPPPSIDGAWTGTWSGTGGNGVISANFTQENPPVGNISGTVNFRPQLATLSAGCQIDGLVESGTRSGNDISLPLTGVDFTLTMTATLST